MSKKSLVRTVLLLFVAISIAVLVVQEFHARHVEQVTAAQPPTKFPRNTRVVAYFFHANRRCAPCVQYEDTAREAIEEAFPNELRQGVVEWKSINLASPENRHFATEYQLYSRTLVLVKVRNGQQVAYNNLMAGWELIENRAALKKFIQAAVSDYLSEKQHG